MKAIVRSLAVEMALQQRATGRRIAQLRERARLTQEAAADRAGVTLRAYQKWEAGGGIQYSNLQKLADALKTTVEEITGEAQTPSPFKVSEQLDTITSDFHGRVDNVEERLTELESRLAGAISEIHKQLRRQTRLLEDIRMIVGGENAFDALREFAEAVVPDEPAAANAPRPAHKSAARRSRQAS